MSLWDKILLVAVGGALGALARYGVVALAARLAVTS
jgi:fluoride ion exporter CrcB/FEX